ncbi:ExeM/NucH family extracellular endonuclease [Arthrobacter sp. Hz1]
MKHSSWKGGLGAVITVGLLASPIAALPAFAAPNGVVINEAYVNGGSANAPYLNKFVELHNTTDQPVDVNGWSLQYRAAGSSNAPTGVSTLTGTVPANGHYLVGGSSNADNGVALPGTDATIGASFADGGGTLILSNEATAIDPLATGSIGDNPAVEDLLGYGSSNTFETAVATKPASNADPRSLNRTDFVDTDDNSADFTLSEAVTPTNADGETGSVEPEPDPDPPVAGAVVPIAEIQGTGDASPLAGDTVTTRGVVTAAYPTGGIDGYVIQTEGTGLSTSEARTASDGIFIYSPGTIADIAIGDHVEVTGQVGENFGVTQIEVVAGAATVLTEPAEEVKSLITLWPATEAGREVLESMLVRPTGDFTVSDNYDLNRYGEIDLAFGTEALVQPTEIAPPGTEENAAVQADNKAHGVTLDDGATVDFVQNTDQALPYLTLEDPVRVNGSATFTSDVIVDFDFGVWRFQPLTHLTAANAAEVQPVTFAGERPATPIDVGGDIKIASFNVLNYFSTTGDELTGCTYFNDRAGNPITVRGGCDARGAANTDSFERQEAKIVDALTNLDADMVSLEEIENSAAFGKDRDEALATLTAALNEVEPGVWDFVPSPAEIPANEDVIRNAFIYKTAAVETVGDSVILDDDVAFSNARKPLAQAFQAADGDESTKFLAIVNHFKSKGSGSGENADQGDGQGASNPDRVEQATALVDFADTMQSEAGTEKVFLTGDFNSYTAEDPMQVFYEAGYTNQGVETDKYSYVFRGQSGSLDHILASPEAAATVTGVDIWNINAVESLAFEYSRFNYTPVNYYTADQYRASDHDPVIVGLDLDEAIEFSDIAGNEHQDHIEWMAGNGLSTGWLEADGTRTYRPLANINRDAMAAFLYRLAGEPDFELPDESPFSDIAFPADEADRIEHFDAIMWMHQTGLSTGWPEADGTRTFRPVTPVNRDAMAAFMMRLATEVCLNADAVSFVNPNGGPFTDVPEGMMFEKEISWLKDTGISEGWGDGTYRPVTPVARDAMAAFVNRFDDEIGTCGRYAEGL